VPIVSAGVHLSFVARPMREAVELMYRQRIHIGSQPDRARSVTALQDAHDPRFA
jgi:hypothetical protein